MRALNRESSERMKRVEESSQNYETMIKELHNHNRAKAEELTTYAEELASYEKRLTQIGKNTSRTEEKVDKLNVAMKSFINVMADVFGPDSKLGSQAHQNHLRKLASFLEKEEAMEIDSDQDNKKRPPPGTGDALRGGGSKK